MIRIFLLLISFVLVGAEKTSSVNFKKGDASAGEQKVAVCAACHGSDGNSQVGNWPKIAGQNERYLFEQLKLIKSEERYIDVMKGLLDTYSEEDLRDVAAFYSQNITTLGQSVDDDSLVLGKLLYKVGDYSRGVPSCQACHMANGSGNSLAGYPAVSGQHKEYLVSTLLAYKNGDRASGVNAYIMNEISQRLSDKDIEALANYITGLY
jgi:cytochrome c553